TNAADHEEQRECLQRLSCEEAESSPSTTEGQKEADDENESKRNSFSPRSPVGWMHGSGFRFPADHTPCRSSQPRWLSPASASPRSHRQGRSRRATALCDGFGSSSSACAPLS